MRNRLDSGLNIFVCCHALSGGQVKSARATQLKRTLYTARFAVLATLVTITATGTTREEASRASAHAQNVTIIRDDWGIAHVYGETDADAVFGMIYAQAEDDFNRIEMN